MSDPKRWRDSEDADLRALVGVLAAAEPKRELRDALWDELASLREAMSDAPEGGLSDDPSGGPSHAAGSAAKVGAIGVKIAVLAGVVGTAIAIVVLSSSTPPVTGRSMDAPPSSGAAAAASSSLAPAPSASVPAALGHVEAQATAETTPVSRPAPTARVLPPPSRSAPSAERPDVPAPAGQGPAIDRLREESEGVRAVRKLVRARNAPAALAELDRLDRLYPAGSLEEEREVLRIEALATAHRTDDAHRRAERFLVERPQSIHAARVKELARQTQEPAQTERTNPK